MPNVWGEVGGLQFALPMEALLGTPYQLLGMNAAGDKLQYKNAFYNNASAQFYVPAGTVGAPAYSFDTDFDTGFYRIGADNVGLALGGVNAVDWNTARAKLSTVLQMNGKIIEEDQSADIVAAATTDLIAATGNSVTITNAAGATAISSLGAAAIPAGTEIETRFSITGGSVSLIYDPVILDVLGQQNINLVDGDVIRWRKTNDAAANWRMTAFARRNFPPVPLTFTAAGDLLVGTGAGTGQIHGIGIPADGKILTKDDSKIDKADWKFPPLTNKNILINGNFDVWQRVTSTTFSGNYAADMWSCRGFNTFTGLTFTYSQNVDVPVPGSSGGFSQYSANILVTNPGAPAAQIGAFGQAIEGWRFAKIAQRSFTLSFWVKSNVPGTYCVGFLSNQGYGTTVNRQTFLGEYVINNADTWEYKTIKVSASPVAGNWNYQTGIGLNVYFILDAPVGLMGGATGVWTLGAVNQDATPNQTHFFATLNNYWRIARVQIEPGDIATEFESRSFDEELDLCMRYYEKSFDYAIAPAQNAGIGNGEYRFAQVVGVSISMECGRIMFKKRKAIEPVITLYNPAAANAQCRNITGGTDYSATAFQSVDESGFNIRATTNAAGAAGNSGGINWAAETGFLVP